MFDKRTIKKSIIIILIVIGILLAITLIRRTLSRYESKAKSTVEADLAFFVVDESFQTKDFFLGEIQPLPVDEEITESHEDYDKYYKEIILTVQNYSDVHSTVPIDYDIIVDASTNMPLEYDIYELEDSGDWEICLKEEGIYEKTAGVFYKKVTAPAGDTDASDPNDFHFAPVVDEVDTIKIKVYFPNYENDDLSGIENNYQFADKVEYLKIQVDARQRIVEEVAGGGES